jgi:hypothetical protein
MTVMDAVRIKSVGASIFSPFTLANPEIIRYNRPKTEDRRPKTEDRRPKTEDITVL